MEKKTESRIGLGFLEALTLLFIALKLTHVINWAWLWVLAPLWISAAIIVVVAVIIVIIYKIREKNCGI